MVKVRGRGSERRETSGGGLSGSLALGVVLGSIVPIDTEEFGMGAASDDASVFHTSI